MIKIFKLWVLFSLFSLCAMDAYHSLLKKYCVPWDIKTKTEGFVRDLYGYPSWLLMKLEFARYTKTEFEGDLAALSELHVKAAKNELPAVDREELNTFTIFLKELYEGWEINQLRGYLPQSSEFELHDLSN